MADFDALFTALEAELDTLKERFLDQFLPAQPSHAPSDFEYEVKSFALLSHAAFEEYVEAVSEAMMQKIESDLLAKNSTLSAACFLTSYGIRLDLPDDESVSDKSCFEHIREAIGKAKVAHSATLKDNHGFSLKYMRRLLIPVGINMPKGPEVESLRKLAEARGSFAHTMAKLAHYGEYKRAKKVLTPEEVNAAALDCRKICEKMKERAKAAW